MYESQMCFDTVNDWIMFFTLWAEKDPKPLFQTSCVKTHSCVITATLLIQTSKILFLRQMCILYSEMHDHDDCFYVSVIVLFHCFVVIRE